MAMNTTTEQQTENIEIKHIFYEDYGKGHDSLQGILDFLEEGSRIDLATIPAFDSTRTYLDMFTPDETNQMWNFLQRFAAAGVWEKLRRYKVMYDQVEPTTLTAETQDSIDYYLYSK